MKNSALRVSATKWKKGLSASRPNDDQRRERQPPPARASRRAPRRGRARRRRRSAPTMTSSGATARSWNRSTAKLARPTGAPSRLPSMRTGMTIAVDDTLSAAATIRAEAGGEAERRGAVAVSARS